MSYFVFLVSVVSVVSVVFAAFRMIFCQCYVFRQVEVRLGESMIELAKKVRAHLMENKDNIQLPFIHNFPKDCCEITSIVLSAVIQKHLPENDIQVSIAYDRYNNEWHYWLEKESEVIDITADQFDSINQPIYGTQDSFILDKFNDIDRKSVNEFLDTNDIYKNNNQEVSRVVSLIKTSQETMNSNTK